MADLANVEGLYLQQVLDQSYSAWHDGLTPTAYGRYYAGQRATSWARGHLQRLALVDGTDVLASAKLYTFDAVLDGAPTRIAGIGALFTAPAHRRRGHARALVERLIERAAADGAGAALLFSVIGADYYARFGFEPIATDDLTLRVIEDSRRGAPMMLVRAGEERDLPDLAAVDRARAEPYRFHLVRDRDYLQYALTKKRLMAGLSAPGARELRFLVAEEGGCAAAYLVVNVRGRVWTVEDCGDRDAGGARVGAILQTMIAADPSSERPSIGGWLPHGFRPPQLEIVGRRPSPEIMMMRPLGSPAPRLAAEDVFFWHGDMF